MKYRLVGITAGAFQSTVVIMSSVEMRTLKNMKAVIGAFKIYDRLIIEKVRS